MPPSAPPSRNRSGQLGRSTRFWWGLLPVMVTLLTGLLLSWHSLSDLDIWFHLRSGRDLLEGQGLAKVNKYSFTEPDHLWVNHEWLFQILATVTGPKTTPVTDGGSDLNVTGWNLLRTTLTLLLLLTVLAGDGIRWRIHSRDGPAAAAWAALPVLAGLFLLWPRLTMRPELFSYIFFVLLVRGSERFFQLPDANSPTDPVPKKWSPLWDLRRTGGRLLLLTVIWAQLHGFAVLAPLMILLAAILASLQRRWYPEFATTEERPHHWKRAAVFVVLLFAALLLTPNGWHGLMMPVRAVGQFFQTKADLRTTISELAPLQDTPNSLGLTITFFRVSLLWSVVWICATAGRVSLLRIVLFALAAVAAWTNQRSIGFYALAFMLIHTGAGSHPWRFSLPRRWPVPPARLIAGTGLVLSLLAGGLFWPQIVDDDFYLREGVGRRFGSGLTPARFPSTSARHLEVLTDPTYFANLDAAAFLLANAPGRGYIDGRTEAYSASLWAEYLEIKRGDDRSLALLTQRQVQAVCLATASTSFDPLAIQLLNSAAWNLAIAEPAGLLFLPRSGAQDSTPVEPFSDHDILIQAAYRALEKSASGSPTRQADFCLSAGHLFRFAQQPDQSAAAFHLGLTFQPDHPTLNHNLGNLLLAQQKFTEAKPLFHKALQMNPRLAGSAVNLGVCQMRLGQPNQAVLSFGRALKVDPDRFEALANLAVALAQTGERTRAIQALEKAVALRPNDQRLRQLLGEWKKGARN